MEREVCSHGVSKNIRCEICVNEGVYTHAIPAEARVANNKDDMYNAFVLTMNPTNPADLKLETSIQYLTTKDPLDEYFGQLDLEGDIEGGRHVVSCGVLIDKIWHINVIFGLIGKGFSKDE